MKRALYISALALLATSCNFLEYDESTGTDPDTINDYFERVEEQVSAVYYYLDGDYGTVGSAMREAGTDNAYYTYSSSEVHNYGNGSWSSTNAVDDRWSDFYSGVRAANKFLEEFSLEEMERFEYNNGTGFTTDYTIWLERASYYEYEVRFIRAYCNFELARRYGDIPLLKTSMTEDQINEVSQTAFADVIAYIVRECDAAAAELPLSYETTQTGRITRYACLALKSRALLYLASPLHNPTSDPDLWKDAADAAYELIALVKDNSDIKLYTTDEYINNKDSYQLILERRYTASNSFEKANSPIGYENALTGTTPTQNLVDAFETIDGEPFDWSDPDMASNPYENRDPRLASTVLYHNSRWQSAFIDVIYGGTNALPIDGATLTGYYLKKQLDEDIAITTLNSTTAYHYWVIFRYPEILLNYAEALNECEGSSYTSSRYPMTALAAVNEVRASVGMPDFDASLDQDAFRTKLRNERRVNFAFEDHRFWDIRRWDIGETTTNIQGVTLTSVGGGVYDYAINTIETRQWDSKMNLYPIPKSEIYCNENLVQNPGW
ncbi:MAG: RagB/SusD family nutrient uptake outer membrane protein [Rikenellaceae bacterium]